MNLDGTPESPDSNDFEKPDRLPEDIDAESLRKYFTLTEADREQVGSCRGAINKVGFAVQLCLSAGEGTSWLTRVTCRRPFWTPSAPSSACWRWASTSTHKMRRRDSSILSESGNS